MLRDAKLQSYVQSGEMTAKKKRCQMSLGWEIFRNYRKVTSAKWLREAKCEMCEKYVTFTLKVFDKFRKSFLIK